MQAPQQTYERRKQAYDRVGTKQRQTANRLSGYRLITFVLGSACSFLIYRVAGFRAGISAGLVTLVVFAYLAVSHQQVRNQLRYAEALSELNRQGLQRLAGEWVSFPDSGAEFIDADHPYASDLDLFGQASLFQWTNSAQTPLGRTNLAEILKHPLMDPVEIGERQEAMTELAGALAWRQRLQAEGMIVSDKFAPIEPLLQWAMQAEQKVTPLLQLVVRVFPVLTILTLILHAWNDIVTWQVPALLSAIQFLLLRLNGKQRSRSLSLVYRYEASLETYAKMLQQIEELPADASWLRTRQSSLKNAQGRLAGEQIQKLSKVAERIANRANPVFFAVNVLTLWDYRCLIALEEWKSESGTLLKTWLEVLAETEALSSLANIRFDHPEWAMPEVRAEYGQGSGKMGGLKAREMAHPLLQNGVPNDFSMEATAPIILVTGSNMSGKSTFLRTVGCNLVLAYAGAPVCAEHFCCSLMSLWTCMRVSDNLEQNVSSFYAEILRIKRIVEAAKVEQPICFLLDEVFKGTNSHDRHLGAKALINQLQKDGAFGLVSTHDLELGDLEQASDGRVSNYHFREYYQSSQIQFDYQLRRGVSTTRNALYLIKMAGIELDEDGQH